MSIGINIIALSDETVAQIKAHFSAKTDDLVEWQQELLAALNAPKPPAGEIMADGILNHVPARVGDAESTRRVSEFLGFDVGLFALKNQEWFIAKGDLLVTEVNCKGQIQMAYAIVVAETTPFNLYVLGPEPSSFNAYARAKSLGWVPNMWHMIAHGMVVQSSGNFGEPKSPDMKFADLALNQAFMSPGVDEIQRKIGDDMALALTGYEEGEELEYVADADVIPVTPQDLMDYGVSPTQIALCTFPTTNKVES